VEGQVGCLVSPWRGGPLKCSDGFVHGREVGLRASDSRKSGNFALDRNAVVDNVVQFVEVMSKPVHPLVVGHQQLGDEAPAGCATTSNDVALVLQQSQGLSNAQTTDAKLIGQLSFGRQLIPRPKLASVDTRPHPIGKSTSGRTGRNERRHASSVPPESDRRDPVGQLAIQTRKPDLRKVCLMKVYFRGEDRTRQNHKRHGRKGRASALATTVRSVAGFAG
jgi:hypothetical protein